MLKFFLIVLAACFIGAAPASDYTVATTFKFGIDLYTAVLAENPNENVIVSPLSVQTALGLLLMSADGTTAEQIVSSSFKTSDRSSIASYFESLLGIYTGDEKLTVVNKVYLKDGYELNPELSEVAKNQFGSELETVNFGESSAAANTINLWVEYETSGKIMDLISPDSLDDTTRMVLVNAVHFKAAWNDKFFKEYTQKRDFWVSETEAVQVDTMVGSVDVLLNQHSVLDAQTIFIPYKNTDLSMVIFLPNSRTGLQEMEGKLRNFNFTSLSFDIRRTQKVHLFMPKFRVDSDLNLKTVLTKMGMVDMFTRDASFPFLINSDEPLRVDEAVHKAYIVVDEEGTEAAAASGFKIVSDSRPPMVRIDHPFMFAIMSRNKVPVIGSVRKF